MKHIKAFTYAPKIPAVLSGECRQTIRPLGKRPVHIGDKILFHSWSGKPYRSPWGWRMEVEVKEVIHIKMSKFCFVVIDHGHEGEPIECILPWNDIRIEDLSRRDYIEPPTAEGLRDAFCSMYDLSEPKEFQIIRW